MSKDTWNFPCYTCNDWGSTDTGDRGAHGMVWSLGPEVSTVQPFVNTITGIFSFFNRSSWGDTAFDKQKLLTSIGGQSAASWGLMVGLQGATTGDVLQIYSYDIVAGAARHQVLLGDDDGINLIQPDKWYQVGFTISSSGFSYAINGSTTPLVHTLASAVDGALNLDTGVDRWWYHPGAAANASNSTVTSWQIDAGYPTYIVGAAAWSTTALDFDDATVRDRIWDSNGNFKNPGENGSLWFGDTYGASIPEHFFLDGSPRRDNGWLNDSTVPVQKWLDAPGGASGSVTSTGGLRKQYEDVYPVDWWVYQSLVLAEASSDIWIDGDTILIAQTGALFVYKTSLSVSGYSGLIHKYPFGIVSEGTLQSALTRGSEAENTDPDTWTDHTLSTTGVDGVDYAADTDGGVSRLRDLTNSGNIIAESNYILTSDDDESFRIIDLAEVVDAVTTSQNLSFEVRRWVDASNYERARVAAFGTPNHPWSYEYTSAGTLAATGVTGDTPRRIYIYVKSGRMAIWFDSSGSISNSNTVPATLTAAGQPMARIDCGEVAASPYTFKLGTDVFGSMTTV